MWTDAEGKGKRYMHAYVYPSMLLSVFHSHSLLLEKERMSNSCSL